MLAAEIGTLVKKVKLIVDGCLITDEIVGVLIREKVGTEVGCWQRKLVPLVKELKLIVDDCQVTNL